MFYPHYLKFTLNLKLLDLCCFGQRLGESQIGLVQKWGILSLRVFARNSHMVQHFIMFGW